MFDYNVCDFHSFWHVSALLVLLWSLHKKVFFFIIFRYRINLLNRFRIGEGGRMGRWNDIQFFMFLLKWNFFYTVDILITSNLKCDNYIWKWNSSWNNRQNTCTKFSRTKTRINQVQSAKTESNKKMSRVLNTQHTRTKRSSRRSMNHQPNVWTR